MVHLNKYLMLSKAKQTRKAINDYFDEFNKTIKCFSKKEFFYFFINENIKYIHKDSLRFRITNADTYGTNISPEVCLLSDTKNIPIINETIKETFNFLTSFKHKCLPDITETENFLKYPFIEGEPLTEITPDEFYELKDFHEKASFTPFYNSMCYNLVRTENSIKIIDLKHFELKDNKPFFIYMYNRDHRINVLYIEEGTPTEEVLKHLSKDYIPNNVVIINKQKD